MSDLNKEFELIYFLYSNNVTFECIDRHHYKKKLKEIDQKRTLLFLSKTNLDLFHPKSCVVSINLSSDDLNKIASATNNTMEVFQTDSINLKFIKLNKSMPQTIGKIHNSLMEEYKNSQKKSILNKMVGIWALTPSKKAFFAHTTVKMLFSENKLSVVAYILAVCYQKCLILNNFGEIDCFGEIFNQITQLNYDVPFTGLSVSIFLFMPALIPYFLSFFYDLPTFYFQNFDYQSLAIVHLFVYENQTELINDLSKKLKKTTNNKLEYCKALFEVLSKIDFEKVKTVYQLSIKFSEFNIQKNKTKAILREIMIKDFKDVTNKFRRSHFLQKTIFISKLNITSQTIESIKFYEARYKEEKYCFRRFYNTEQSLPRVHLETDEENHSEGNSNIVNHKSLGFLQQSCVPEREKPVGDSLLVFNNLNKSQSNNKIKNLKTGVRSTSSDVGSIHINDIMDKLEKKVAYIKFIEVFRKTQNPTRQKWMILGNQLLQKQSTLILNESEDKIGKLIRKFAEEIRQKSVQSRSHWTFEKY